MKKTVEEKLIAHREANKKWRNKNKDKRKEYQKNHPEQTKKWRNTHKEQIAQKNKEYYKTPKGRASRLLGGYKIRDKKYNRGDCSITSQWIVDNIFSTPCYYCGEIDWHKLGCDRIDNSLPHTPDNVVCSCWKCNDLRGRLKLSVEEFKQYIRANSSPS